MVGPKLQAIRTPFKVERDLFFEGKYPISVYASAARQVGAITEDDTILQDIACK